MNADCPSSGIKNSAASKAMAMAFDQLLEMERRSRALKGPGH